MPEPNRVDDWISDYLAGELTGEARRALERWLLEDDAHTEQLARAVLLDSQMRSAVVTRRLQSGLSVLAERGGGDQELQSIDQEIMHELVDEALAERRRKEIEEATNATLVVDRGRSAGEDEPLRLGAALRVIAASKQVRWLAAAAVLGLAVTLFFVFQGGPTPPQDLVETTGQADPVPRVVATLTAEHDAVWERRPGEDLYANQRFTLTQGFAEITTSDGAVAILEAPVTIELLDSGNALYLHTGKLVGICETESSTGFTVHTPHARIVDLGTEFGVTVQQGRVETVVFDGEVVVHPARPGGDSKNTASVRLSRGQYAVVGPAGTLVSGDVADSGVGLSYARSLNPNEVASRRYTQAVLESKPVIYWGMQGLTAQTAVNGGIAGNRYDGRAQASERREGGIGGAYAHFGNAEADSIIAVDEPIEELQGVDSYSIECWARVGKHHRGMIAVLTSGNRLNTMHLEVLDQLLSSDRGGTARTVRFVHRSKPSQAGGQQLYSDPYPLGAWMHLVCVKNGDGVALYVDGELVAQEACKRLISGTPHLMIGRLNPKQGTPGSDIRAFYGGLDEFALYPHPLGPEAIRRHYALGTDALVDQ
ncbi:MAG: FecR domain-containing protein [Phycisphaeraceae bacterium]|nr:FecR domain-containing protein [Phycisphaeraceae bacterium]